MCYSEFHIGLWETCASPLRCHFSLTMWTPKPTGIGELKVLDYAAAGC